MFNLIKNIWGKKKVKFIKHAKIVFKEEAGDNPIDNPLLKNILIYIRDELIEELDYSSVILDELKKEGTPILDETLEIKKYLPAVGIDVGKVNLT